jgi:hypothetical protein
MSGFSDNTECPNCGEDCNRYSDYKPFDLVSLDCDNCGFYTDTVVKQLSLEELNDRRKDLELPALAELPNWNLNDYGFVKQGEEQ